MSSGIDQVSRISASHSVGDMPTDRTIAVVASNLVDFLTASELDSLLVPGSMSTAQGSFVFPYCLTHSEHPDNCKYCPLLTLTTPEPEMLLFWMMASRPPLASLSTA